MILLEINEFNPQLMDRASDAMQGKNLKRLLSLHHSSTLADETHERFGLDPWVQWVSIHTGVPATKHKVAHLGDVPNLGFPQIWEDLSSLGFRSGVWGAMNASKSNCDKCDFFFPDPWTFSEQAYPGKTIKTCAQKRY
jgi:hypothetical protein